MKLTRLSLLGLLLGLFGGCRSAWQVVRVSGPPSALGGQTDVAIAFDYSQMYVEGRTEADWVTQKTNEDAKYPAIWADLKGRFEDAVVEGMRSQFPAAHAVERGENGVVMVVQVHSFKLGKLIPPPVPRSPSFGMPPTWMEASLVFQVGGQATDEISLMRSHPPSITQPSVFNHIPYVGDAFGRAGARFLSSKQP